MCYNVYPLPTFLIQPSSLPTRLSILFLSFHLSSPICTIHILLGIWLSAGTQLCYQEQHFLKKTDSFTHSYQLPIAPQLGVEFHVPPLFSMLRFVCLQFSQVLGMLLQLLWAHMHICNFPAVSRKHTFPVAAKFFCFLVHLFMLSLCVLLAGRLQ